MKKLFALPIAAMLFAACSPSPTVHPEFEEYMQTFPESSLCDVYKWCFQDVFGVAHLVTDTAASAAYVRSELAHMTDTHSAPPYYYTGPDGRYVRVNLSLVADGTLTIEQVVSAVARSAQQPPSMTQKQWAKTWRNYQRELNEIDPRPLNFDVDEKKIDSLLSAGQYVMHHSRHFNETYSYFYRIIAREIFEKELLPLINEEEI
ncbi:MAG: hypothetical protein IJ789_03055 [Bacteroidales bacterium]|nr:hypothetical protein [Bacteroidales bacterium]